MRATLIAIACCLATTLHAQPAADPSVSCRVKGDPSARVFRLESVGGSWRLSFRKRETGERWVRLALPNAKPVIGRDSVRLSYRNANGGRQVDLAATPETSSLDVWVDHGLEVNIEPDLDPEVDLMNTNGPLAGVRCSIEPAM